MAMDAKDLRTESALSERNNDSSKYSQSGGIALPCERNKSYQDAGSNSLPKVDVQGARPCAVIGPDRVVPPATTNEPYFRKGPDPWPCMDNAYHHTRRPPEYPHKLANFQNPTRNISPRQTFQENMQRIMVPPSYNSVKINDDINYNQMSERSNVLPKNIKINVPSEAKFCDVPYTVYPTSNEQKNVRNSDMCLSSVNPTLTRTTPHGWPPGSVNVRPTRPYGAPELYQYQEYSSCAGPRPVAPRPNRTGPEDPGYIYAEPFYHQEGNIRFKPYPPVKERFPQQRYDYVSNYTNSFHSQPSFPSHKYELQKSVPPNPYPPYTPIKYLDRVTEPVLEGYQRNQQNNFNIPYRNQIIHPNFGSVIGSCPQNKIHSYPADGHIKTVGHNKLPYENAKAYVEYENGRPKMYPPSESYVVNEMSRMHPMKTQVIMHNYPSINMHNIPSNQYYKKENPQMKNYEYMQAHFRGMDPNLNLHNPMARHQPVFSPNTLAISPTDSSTSNDTSQTLGNSQEDCGYVSQSSNASARSVDSGINRLPNDYIRKYYDSRYGSIMRTSSMMSKSELNSINSSKEKKNIDVRQFLQMWNEGDEETDENIPKEIIIQTGPKSHSNFGKTHEVISQANQEQLYVLGLVNVPREELGKYEHIQKVSKLPENIKGYNHIELLNQFEEAIESSNLTSFKTSTSKDFQMAPKVVQHKQGPCTVPPRPLSPLDVEAKISQSVIHKEVGCNFEIKPCSPKMLNADVATPVQNILSERVIEKVANPVILKSPRFNGVDENMDCNIIKRKEHRLNHNIINNEPIRIPSCKMINTQFSNNTGLDTIKNSYSFQDLESNSGLCLASLPRLDNDIELNFPEVNQQFINANKRDPTVLTNSLRDLPTLEVLEQSDNQTKEELNDTNLSTCESDNIRSPCLESEKEFSKLSKYRKTRPHVSDSKDNHAVRTDSVIIKNPENIKNCEESSIFSPNSLIKQVNDIQQVPINLTSQANIAENSDNLITVKQHDTNTENDSSVDIAIDFSLNRNSSNDNIACIGVESGKETSILLHSKPKVNQSLLDEHLTKLPTFSDCQLNIPSDCSNNNKVDETNSINPEKYSVTETVVQIANDKIKETTSSVDNLPIEETFAKNEYLSSVSSDKEVKDNYIKAVACVKDMDEIVKVEQNKEDTRSIADTPIEGAFTKNAYMSPASSGNVSKEEHITSSACVKGVNETNVTRSKDDKNSVENTPLEETCKPDAHLLSVSSDMEVKEEHKATTAYVKDMNDDCRNSLLPIDFVGTDTEFLKTVDNNTDSYLEIDKKNSMKSTNLDKVNERQTSPRETSKGGDLKNHNDQKGTVDVNEVKESESNIDTRKDSDLNQLLKNKFSEAKSPEPASTNCKNKEVNNDELLENKTNTSLNLISLNRIPSVDTETGGVINHNSKTINDDYSSFNVPSPKSRRNYPLETVDFKNYNIETGVEHSKFNLSSPKCERDYLSETVKQNLISNFDIITNNIVTNSEDSVLLEKKEGDNDSASERPEGDFFSNFNITSPVMNNPDDPSQITDKGDSNFELVNHNSAKINNQGNESPKTTEHETVFNSNLPSRNNTCQSDIRQQCIDSNVDILSPDSSVTHTGRSEEVNNTILNTECFFGEESDDQKDITMIDSKQCKNDLFYNNEEKLITDDTIEFKEEKMTRVQPNTRYLSYGSKEMYSPWIQKLVMFCEGNTNNVNINYNREDSDRLMTETRQIEDLDGVDHYLEHDHATESKGVSTDGSASPGFINSKSEMMNLTDSLIDNHPKTEHTVNINNIKSSQAESEVTETKKPYNIDKLVNHEDLFTRNIPGLHMDRNIDDVNETESMNVNNAIDNVSDEFVQLSNPGQTASCLPYEIHEQCDKSSTSVSDEIANQWHRQSNGNDKEPEQVVSDKSSTSVSDEIIDQWNRQSNGNDEQPEQLVKSSICDKLSEQWQTQYKCNVDLLGSHDQQSNCSDEIPEQWDKHSICNDELPEILDEQHVNNKETLEECDDQPFCSDKEKSELLDSQFYCNDEVPEEQIKEIHCNVEELICDNEIFGQKEKSEEYYNQCNDDDDEIQKQFDGQSTGTPENVEEVDIQSDCNNIGVELSITEENSQVSCTKVQNSEYIFLNKNRKVLKRSLSDSAINVNNSKNEPLQSENEESVHFIWPFKRRKMDNVDNDILAQNLCNIIQSNRRNSISSIYNEENLSFCILIDNSCIIAEEENDEQDKICYTHETEECLTDVQNDGPIDEDNTEIISEIKSTPEHQNDCEYSDSYVMQGEEEKLEESWVEDVACVETVISDDIAEDIEISGASSPKENEFSDNDESGVFSSSEHTDKVKYIYGDKMCNDDAQFVETLFNTPQMDVNKRLIQRESLVSCEYYDNDSLEKILSESNDQQQSPYVPEYVGPIFSPRIIDSQQTIDNKENMNLEIRSPLQNIANPLDMVDMGIVKTNEENVKLGYFNKTQDDTVHSCESSVDNVFSYKESDENIKYITSSSPEVSSTTPEEKNSAILLKITNYKGSRISQINDNSRDHKRPSCKFTEDKDFVQSHSNFPSHRPLLTKGAQKYIPPLKESMRDLKVKLSLPQHSLMKLKQLKKSKDAPKVYKKQNTSVPTISKKPKPKFEDVLKSIDEIHFKKHKERTKKSKKSIPKVVIKKNENGSHYASTSNKNEFNPDLTGRKWQPWVFIEKNHFIDKMAIKKKTKAVYSHRKQTYVLAEKFQKYKSVSSAKFVIAPPLSDCPPTGLKYTIRLKHNYH